MFNTWEWIRICGFLAYFYFTVSVIFGLFRKSPSITKQKNLLFHLHLSAGWLGLLALIMHVLLLLIDHYQPYSIIEILVPFTAKYKPLLSAIGTISLYVFLVVIMTSDLLIRKMNRQLWKSIHFLVLPAWVMIFLHGVFIGTDSANPIIQLFYIVTGSIIIIASCLRVYGTYTKATAASLSKKE
ncbi:ferric reductase-like transmembrane domain-containing protein [Rummeliibacillus sp. NPDC094406]|uniref:ferric reductase-like transmembrane domain-containing protein n=1 Tax=Rummeliibacillus sp. NPDC094406 TaxID=3364511 RepID=UPI003826AFFE